VLFLRGLPRRFLASGVAEVTVSAITGGGAATGGAGAGSTDLSFLFLDDSSGKRDSIISRHVFTFVNISPSRLKIPNAFVQLYALPTKITHLYVSRFLELNGNVFWGQAEICNEKNVCVLEEIQTRD
jgi:hypothetical protein